MMARIMGAIWRGGMRCVNLLAPDLAKTNSIAKKFPEPLRRQGRIARRILNIAMPEIGLNRARVVSVIGELVAAGRPSPRRSSRPDWARKPPVGLTRRRYGVDGYDQTLIAAIKATIAVKAAAAVIGPGVGSVISVTTQSTIVRVTQA